MLKKISEDIKQYGLVAFGKFVIKFFFRKLGIEINTYYYMVNCIDAEIIAKSVEISNLSNIKKLKYDDFLKGNETVFNKQKLEVIRNRFSCDGYYAYGIVQKDHLVYSCWLSLNKIDLPIKDYLEYLAEDEALFVDDFCDPMFRGKGIHTSMNAYRLCQMIQFNRTKAVVIIMKDNIPAYKSQIKVGFKILFRFSVLNLCGNTYTNYFKRKQKFLKNDSKKRGF